MSGDVSDLAVFDAALAAWGKEAQIRQLQEECAELIAVLNQWLRHRATDIDVLEEAVDVDIMLGQLRRILNDESKFGRYRAFKLERVRSMLPAKQWAQAYDSLVKLNEEAAP